jgi:hypothetical protein
MQLAVAMGNESSGRQLLSLSEPARLTAHVEMSLSTHSARRFKH